MNSQTQLDQAIQEKTDELAAARVRVSSARLVLGRNPADATALRNSRDAQATLDNIQADLQSLTEAREAAIAFDLSTEGRAIRANRRAHLEGGKQTARSLEPVARQFDALVNELITVVAGIHATRTKANDHLGQYVGALPLTMDEKIIIRACQSPFSDQGSLAYALSLALWKIADISGLKTSDYITWGQAFGYSSTTEMKMEDAARIAADQAHSQFARMEKQHA